MKLEVIYRPAEGEPRKTPLLFVHGSWHAAWCWDVHFMPYFARAGYSTYSVSLQGHGLSEGHENLRCTTIAQFVANVASVARDLPAPPVVIGHSLGGYVVQQYIESHPAAGAVLLASMPPRGALPSMVRLMYRTPWQFVKACLKISMYPFISTAKLARAALFTPDLSDAKVAEYWALLQDESVRAFLEILIVFPRPRRGKAPVLVLGDALDKVFYQYQIHATARYFGTEAEIFPNMAHDMMLEPQWEQVASRIAAWLEQTLATPR